MQLTEKEGGCPMGQALKWRHRWLTSVRPLLIEGCYIREENPHKEGIGKIGESKEEKGEREREKGIL